ncbi:MAG: hypothetical protein IPN03_23955 [Holophagales bacterium]|nr:hypothetical protein [Holophagales bacterium]
MKPPWALLLLALLACSSAGAQTPDGRGFDPTGVWYGQHGPLALMRAGDTLTFSYSGVFGATAHICDGIGVAGFAGDGTWEHADEQGTVTFTTKGGKVTMQTTNGSPHSAAPTGPVTFTKDGWKPAFNCTVVAPKAHFLTAAPSPEQRKGYVVKGNVVEAVGLVNEGTPGWLPRAVRREEETTAGLLERDALECREEK